MKKEETYKNKTNEYPKKNTKFKYVWSFLGEPFSLWILSSLFLGLITFMYTQWDNEKKQQIQESILLSKVRLEILYRTSAAQKIIDFSDKEDIMKYGVDILLKPPLDSGTYVFVEYKERSLKSILWESSLIDLIDKIKLDSLISKCEQFELYYYHNITIRKTILGIIEIKKSSNGKIDFDKQKQDLNDFIVLVKELYH